MNIKSVASFISTSTDRVTLAAGNRKKTLSHFQIDSLSMTFYFEQLCGQFYASNNFLIIHCECLNFPKKVWPHAVDTILEPISLSGAISHPERLKGWRCCYYSADLIPCLSFKNKA